MACVAENPIGSAFTVDESELSQIARRQGLPWFEVQ